MGQVEHHENWLTQLQKGSYALISDGPNVDTAVIFVHGFLGDPAGTWLNFQEEICAPSSEQSLWSNCDIFFFSYRSFRDDITESAEVLLKFIETVFPDPPTWLFEVPIHIKRLPEIGLDLTTHKPIYKQLVLVGHSEGGVVIRRAVDIAYSRGMRSVLASRLALFAPAHKGVKLSGWIGACLAVGRVDAVLAPILSFSGAFLEMNQETLLEEIHEHTRTYRDQCKEAKEAVPPSLHAHIVFGSEDHVVQKGYYAWDCFHASEKGKDHVSICKPSAAYNRPIKFVLDRIMGVERCTDLTSS